MVTGWLPESNAAARNALRKSTDMADSRRPSGSIDFDNPPGVHRAVPYGSATSARERDTPEVGGEPDDGDGRHGDGTDDDGDNTDVSDTE